MVHESEANKQAVEATVLLLVGAYLAFSGTGGDIISGNYLSVFGISNTLITMPVIFCAIYSFYYFFIKLKKVKN